MQAKNVMTTNVVSVSEETSIRETCQMLLKYKITGLPVVNAQQRLVGVITEFGLMEALYNPEILDDPIRDYMTRDVLTVDENEPLAHVANLFLLHRIRRLPVVRNKDMNGQVVGVISRRDLIKVVIESNHGITNAPAAAQAV